MIQKISKLMDYIARNILKIVFLVFLLAAIIIKSMYSFLDMPYFELTGLYDVGMMILALVIYGLIYWKRDLIQEKGNYLIGFIIFIIIAIAFIYLVPLKPFSDMQHVYDAAIKFGNREWASILDDEYWNTFPSNVRLGIFWGVLISLLPKSLVTFKILNSLFAYGTIYFIAKLCKLYGFKYDKIIYCYLLIFSPLIIYINHVYFDMPYLFFCALAVYLNKRYDNIIFSGMALAAAAYLRKSAKIYLVAIILIVVFDKFKGFKSLKSLKSFKQLSVDKKIVKEAVKVILAIAICLGISRLGINLVKSICYGEDYKSYSSWNQIYIGLNEERLGMMDMDFSYDRTAQDVIDRIVDYGPIKTTEILAKKTFWLWTQGTYQSQRYGFGIDTQLEEEKFEYSTILTNHLLNDTQPLRRMINAFMRAQYLIIFALMVITLWKKKDISDIRIWYYIIIATFLTMIVYELKSRYIFQCIPAMAILACQALEYIPDIKKGLIKKSKISINKNIRS